MTVCDGGQVVTQSKIGLLSQKELGKDAGNAKKKKQMCHKARHGKLNVT